MAADYHSSRVESSRVESSRVEIVYPLFQIISFDIYSAQKQEEDEEEEVAKDPQSTWT